MKTNRIKITIDRAPISSEEIGNMQDFGQVLKKSGSGGGKVWKPALYVAGAVLVAGLAWTVFHFTQENNSLQVEQSTPGIENSQEGLDVKAKTPFVNPPVKDWDIPYSTYEIDALTGGSINHLTGSTIEIPPQCLLDENGNGVSGKVEIRYREFHDGLDFALSGIPMTYDSAGMQYLFESGGMCEILAFQNNKPLSIKPGESLKIDMVSKQEGMYNLYQLDTTAKNWVHKGNTRGDKAPTTPPLTTQPVLAQTNRVAGSEKIITETDLLATREIAKVQNEIKEIKKEKPSEPIKANPNRPRFNLNIEEKDYPELAGFKKMLFEVAPEDKSFLLEYYKITWTNITLERYQGIKYKMILERDITTTTKGVTTPTGKTEKVELIVFPVFDEKDFPAAQQKYEEMLQDYNTKLDTRLKKEAQLKKEAEEARKKAEEDYRKRAEEARKKAIEDRNQLEAARQRNEQDMNIRREFVVANFGIWNCDNPVMSKKPSSKMLSFNDEEGKELPVGIVYQVINNNVLMCNYFNQCCNNLTKYDKNDTNLLFSMLPDGRVAFAENEDWERAGGRHLKLKMKVSAEKFKTAEEVRKFLGM